MARKKDLLALNGLIADLSPRVSDRFINRFLTYEEAQELIKSRQRNDKVRPEGRYLVP
jgi:hypothetical protein